MLKAPYTNIVVRMNTANAAATLREMAVGSRHMSTAAAIQEPTMCQRFSARHCECQL
jgi:hypothetical protein